MSPSTPSNARRSDAASQDAIGTFMLRQRPEVVGTGKGTGPLVDPGRVGEKISDMEEILRILQACMSDDEADEDVLVELLMLESMLENNPLKEAEILAQLGALGDDVRDGLMPPGVINVSAIRQRTRRLRQQLGSAASRVSAAIMLLLTGLTSFSQEARAASEDAGYAAANTPVVRVIDAATGQGMAGVQIKTMEERLLGVTDANGQATLADGYMETDLLSLEKDGYEMYLLDRSQLSTRNIVSMKPLSGAVAARPSESHAAASRPAVKTPTPPKPSAHQVAHVTAPKAPAAHAAPHVTAPKAPAAHAAPKAPAAPSIRLPVRPRPTAAAALHARASAAPETHAAATPEVHLPARPKRPDATMAPVAHAPAAHAPRGHEPSVSTPSRPRLPLMAQHHEAAPSHAHVSVPRRMPRLRTAGNHAAPAGGSYYRVRPGDSLAAIAKRHLGSAKRWPELYALNRGRVANPALIRAGQNLVLPSAQMAATGGGTYVVKPGDCLFTIASSQLGSGAKWRSLWQANRFKIRDARFIYPGQELTLPMA